MDILSIKRRLYFLGKLTILSIKASSKATESCGIPKRPRFSRRSNNTNMRYVIWNQVWSHSNDHPVHDHGSSVGTTDEIQVSVTTHPDFIDEKISEPIRIVCPERPSAPKIEEVRAEKPFSIYIQWKHKANEKEEISAFRIFLDGKLHGEMEASGRQSFKYELNKLAADREYSIYVKSVVGEKKLDGYAYRCAVESKASNELALRCAAPPRGTTPRLERMYPHGVELTWDAPVEHAQVKITVSPCWLLWEISRRLDLTGQGYQLLKNGRAIGKSIPANQRRTSVNDLNVGNRYSFQVVPITDQPGGTAIRSGEGKRSSGCSSCWSLIDALLEYDPQRHGHYLPGTKLEVEFTDLIQLPEKFWIENIAGRTALVCWSPGTSPFK